MSASSQVDRASRAASSSAALDGAPRHAIAFRRRRFANWFPLGLTYACFYMGRYNFNVAKGAIGAAYHYDKAQMGIIATAGFWTYALSVLFNGPLADRFGGRRAILFGALGAAALNVAIGMIFLPGVLTNVIVVMSLLYSVNMYFQSFGALSVVKVNSAWFHVRERGVLGGFFGAMISTGYALALITGGWILTNLPLWCVFVVPSGVILTMFAVDFFLVRNKPSDAGHDDFATGDEQAGEDPSEQLSFGERMRRVLSHPVIRVLLVAEFCTGLVRQGLLLYFTEFLKEVHGVAPGSTWFKVASWGVTVGGIAGAFACGYLSDYLFQSRRAPVAFLFYLGQVVSLVLLGLAGSPQLAAVMIGVSCMWIFGVHGMLSGTASMDFGGRKAAATAAGLLDGVQYLGSGLVGFGLGWLLDKYHWKIWPYALIPFSVVGAGLMLLLWNARPSRGAAH
jgi:MFS transporter, OPA family, glycerol-3-phosphate transporter